MLISITSSGTTTAASSDPAVSAQDLNRVVIERRRHVMGTWLRIRVQGSARDLAVRASEDALDAIADADGRLSTWRPDSELAEVNANAARRPVKISEALQHDLTEAMRWHRETSSAFSPGLGALVSVWDLRGRGRVPSRTELAVARWNTVLEGSAIDGEVVRFDRPGLRIDEGGFGKGAALNDGLRAALEAGATCVTMDFGGQVAQRGSCGPLVVGISNPDDRSEEIATVSVGSGGVATSGQTERFMVVDRIRYGHILDPRSGSPAPDWGSVTVVTSDPLSADCIATALYVMGPDHGARWVGERTDVEAVFAIRTESGPLLRATSGLRGRLTSSAGIDLEWVPPIDTRSQGPP
ncbi:MAG: FAD:protein FMN transferase [Candidatus Sulfomarinibacteraceae bacterium]